MTAAEAESSYHARRPPQGPGEGVLRRTYQGNLPAREGMSLREV